MSASLITSLASLPEKKRLKLLASLTDKQAEDLLWDWRAWARPEQLAPEGEWSTWLILAGRGFGKTRCGAEWVRDNACGKTPFSKGKYRRFALVAETAADARDVLVEGESGILSVHPKGFRPIYEPSKRRLTWPNGAVATLYNATEPDQLRGPQHDAAWADELCKWRYAEETWDQLAFGLRLGDDPKCVITTTPRPIPVLRDIKGEAGTITTGGSTDDNKGNLAPKFIKKIYDKYAGTRLGRQELSAEILDDVPGALWTLAMLDSTRLRDEDPLPDFRRIVVAIDPSGAGSSEDGSDEIGIVCAGIGTDGRGYVLGDWSIHDSPEKWAKRAIECASYFGADRIIAEKNFGGAMVEAVMRAADKDRRYPVKLVTASRGKVQRAEPVALLYEQGRVSHCGAFPELEDQFCGFTPTGYIGSSNSPDRADAAIWALSELFLGEPGLEGWMEFYGEKLAGLAQQ